VGVAAVGHSSKDWWFSHSRRYSGSNPYVLQRAAVCCSVLQFVAVCCHGSVISDGIQVRIHVYYSVLQCVVACCFKLHYKNGNSFSMVFRFTFMLVQRLAVCCSVLHRVAACCSVLQSGHS